MPARRFAAGITAMPVLLSALGLPAQLGSEEAPALPAGAEQPAADDPLRRLQAVLESDPGLAPQTRQALLEALRALQTEGAARRSEAAAEPGPVSKGVVARAVDEYLRVRPPPREKTLWDEVLERLAVYGDLRLRHESSFALDDKDDRHRQRLRLRLGANYQVLDDLLVGARLSTGSRDDPASPHVTFGDLFRQFEISVDRAFLNYRPAWLDGATATAGKFAPPFFQNPVYGELVWDADVQPEGAVIGYSIAKVGPFEGLELVAGEYILLEQEIADEALATVVQARGSLRLFGDALATLAVGHYFYTDVTPGGSEQALPLGRSNATVDRDGDGTADDFVSRFSTLNPIAALSATVLEVPAVASAEYILNTEVTGSEGQGWAVGVAAGRIAKQGDFRIYYQWQVVEQDAVFAAFAQDDFLFRTNHRSHLFGANYQLSDKVGLHVWGLVSRRDSTFSGATTDSDDYQWRVRLDLNVRF
jgi:hypothetical protein